MHQSLLDSIHQDMFQYKTKQQDETNNECSSKSHMLNHDLERMNKVHSLLVVSRQENVFIFLFVLIHQIREHRILNDCLLYHMMNSIQHEQQ